MSENLKPCPFCAGEALVIVTELGREVPLFRVECADTNCAYSWHVFRAAAELSWNHRADRWIPVSERLPEKRGHYLVTCKNITYGISACVEAFYSSSGWRIHESYDGSGYDSVIAWRQRPEPYKEEK